MTDKATNLVTDWDKHEWRQDYTKVVFECAIPMDKLVDVVKAEEAKTDPESFDLWYLFFDDKCGRSPFAGPHGLALVAGAPFPRNQSEKVCGRIPALARGHITVGRGTRKRICYVDKAGSCLWMQPNVHDVVGDSRLKNIVSASLYRLEVVKTMDCLN